MADTAIDITPTAATGAPTRPRYGSISKDIQEFAYRIKATNVGTYAIPPAYGEAMYERKVQARSVGGRIVVEAR